MQGSPQVAQMESIRGYVLLASRDVIQVFKANSTGLHAIILQPLEVLAQEGGRQVNN